MYTVNKQIFELTILVQIKQKNKHLRYKYKKHFEILILKWKQRYPNGMLMYSLKIKFLDYEKKSLRKIKKKHPDTFYQET